MEGQGLIFFENMMNKDDSDIGKHHMHYIAVRREDWDKDGDSIPIFEVCPRGWTPPLFGVSDRDYVRPMQMMFEPPRCFQDPDVQRRVMHDLDTMWAYMERHSIR